MSTRNAFAILAAALSAAGLFKHNGKEDDALRELNVRCILWRIAEIRRKWGRLPVIGGGGRQ